MANFKKSKLQKLWQEWWRCKGMFWRNHLFSENFDSLHVRDISLSNLHVQFEGCSILNPGLIKPVRMPWDSNLNLNLCLIICVKRQKLSKIHKLLFALDGITALGSSHSGGLCLCVLFLQRLTDSTDIFSDTVILGFHRRLSPLLALKYRCVSERQPYKLSL